VGGGAVSFCLEFSGPWQWKPGRFSNTIMFRVWWGPVAFGWLRVPFHEYPKRTGGWVDR